MNAISTNPMMSQIMGAAGDLGLGAGTQDAAQQIADELKKKKQQFLSNPLSNKYGAPNGPTPLQTPGMGASSALFM